MSIAKSASLLRKEIIKETKSTVPSQVWGAMVWGMGNLQTSRWDRRNIIEQAYERNAPFYAAVNIIAQTVADIPVKVRTTHNGKFIDSPTHPILKVLDLNEPRAQFIERFCKYYIALGTSYAEIIFSEGQGKKRPLGAIVMPAQFVKNVQGDYRKPIIGYEYTENKTVRLDESCVVHLYSPSLSRYFEEISPAIPLAEIISLNNAAITWNKNVAQKGGMPPVVAKAQGIGKTQAQEIRDDWEEQSGANSSHRLKIVSNNLEFERMATNPHDAEWEKAVLSSMRMILMGLGVSSSLMNDAGNKTYNNVHDARKALFTELSIPVAKRIYEAFTRKLQRYYSDNPEIIVDTRNIEAIQEDKKIAVERLQRAVDAGILTANEARAELGYPAADGPTANMLQNAKIINNIPKVALDGEDESTPNEQADENESGTVN